MKNVQDYLDRSGDRKLAVADYIEQDSHGWMTYSVFGRIMFVFQVYGVKEGKYWDSKIEQLANKHGCKEILFHTRRNPETFERMFGYKLKGFVMSKEVE